MTGLSGPVSLRTRALQQHALNGGSYSRPDHALHEPVSIQEAGSWFSPRCTSSPCSCDFAHQQGTWGNPAASNHDPILGREEPDTGTVGQEKRT